MSEPIFTGEQVCLVLDVTGSMQSHINTIQDLMIQYVIRRAAEYPITALGLVLVDDHYLENYIHRDKEAINARTSMPARVKDWPVIPFAGVTDNLEEYAWWLERIVLRDGGDTPECYACGVATARTIMPEASIWVVGDAFPHGTQRGDNHPSGCPLGHPTPQGVNVICRWEAMYLWHKNNRFVDLDQLRETLSEPRSRVVRR